MAESTDGGGRNGKAASASAVAKDEDKSSLRERLSAQVGLEIDDSLLFEDEPDSPLKHRGYTYHHGQKTGLKIDVTRFYCWKTLYV